jgi:uncharacterized membrane protein (DUF485 family)
LAGLEHHVHHPTEEEDPGLAAGNARRGLVLFTIYLTVYAGFVLLSAFGRPVMERIVLGGVNLAVWYGFGLIGGALLLALLYAWLCRRAAAAKERA